MDWGMIGAVVGMLAILVAIGIAIWQRPRTTVPSNAQTGAPPTLPPASAGQNQNAQESALPSGDDARKRRQIAQSMYDYLDDFRMMYREDIEHGSAATDKTLDS